MRRGMNGLTLQVQETLKRDPHGGGLYIFRGGRGDLLKILWHDGLGMWLYAKRLGRLPAPPKPQQLSNPQANTPVGCAQTLTLREPGAPRPARPD